MTVGLLDAPGSQTSPGWDVALPAPRYRKGYGRWPDSAPFRAHVMHLMAASGLSAQELAALTRVSVRLIRRLIGGRDGRPMRRIDPLSAHRLIAVTTLDASLVRSRVVPAGRARATTLLLQEGGRHVSSLARLTGLSSTDVLRLADGTLSMVPQLVDLRLGAALIDSTGPVDRVGSGEGHRIEMADAA